jgi:hypothetical protein
MWRRYWLVFLLTVAFGLPGCGRAGAHKKYKVSGTVTFDGANIQEGRILFLPKDGEGPADGGSIVDGKYEIQCTEGKKRVEIRANTKGKGTHKMPEKLNMPSPGMMELIPAKYNANSTLEADVTTDPAQNTFDFKLEKK